MQQAYMMQKRHAADGFRSENSLWFEIEASWQQNVLGLALFSHLGSSWLGSAWTSLCHQQHTVRAINSFG